MSAQIQVVVEITYVKMFSLLISVVPNEEAWHLLAFMEQM